MKSREGLIQGILVARLDLLRMGQPVQEALEGPGCRFEALGCNVRAKSTGVAAQIAAPGKLASLS